MYKKKKFLIMLELLFLLLLNNLFMYSLGNKYINITNILKPTLILNKNKIGNNEGIYFNLFLLFNKNLSSKEQENFKKFLLFGNLGLFYFIYIYKKQKLDYYGTAEFANNNEIKDMKILDPSDGVILGLTQDNKLISHNGVEHLMVMAPTRSGKGVNTVLPTLWTWKSSVIINDIKGECWDLTSGFRRSVLGQKCVYFNPMDSSGEGICYNPLALVKVGTGSEQEDSRVIAMTLIDVDGKGEADHWISSAINLLTAVIIHVKYVNINATFLDVMKFLTDPNEPLIDKMGRVLAKKLNEYGETIDDDTYQVFNHYETLKNQIGTNLDFMELYNELTTLHPLVGSTFSSLMNTPDKERGSIISSCVNKLKIFGDPRIMKNIQSSDITPRDIMNNKISLYLITPPRAIDMTRPLFRLIITQTIFELTDKMEFGNRKKIEKEKQTLVKKFKENLFNFFQKKEEKKENSKNKRILFLIDEFPALGNLGLLEKALAYIAGYGLKVLLITQAISQLNKIYGKDNSIIANCHGQLYFTPNDSETPKLISDMLGTKTIKIETKSKTKGQITYSENYQSRALMTQGEVRTLPFEDTILIITGKKPIHGKKLFWFKHEKFKNNVNYNIPYKSYLELLEKIEKEGYDEYVLEYLIYKKNGYKPLKVIIDNLGQDKFIEEILKLDKNYQKKMDNFFNLSEKEKEEKKNKIAFSLLKKHYGKRRANELLSEYLDDFRDEEFISCLITQDGNLEQMLDRNLKDIEEKLNIKEKLNVFIIHELKKKKIMDSNLPIISTILPFLLKKVNENYSFENLKIDLSKIISDFDFNKFITIFLEDVNLSLTEIYNKLLDLENYINNDTVESDGLIDF
ncbi:type IV secretory system conjugative DNA transfer family protein [Fusobacterium sp. SYSU M8D902]|uniref:type IV secretory system conjugative DNA transfer family protein n=1 Tax=Fusobacterium sp. SYSU M8D902 TaxID=3159562 RepID=UPI0032E4A027